MLVHQWRKYLSPLARAIGPRAAQQELRWMIQALHHPPPDPPPRAQDPHARLETMVQRRVSGEPLQYILGTQPFGILSLFARPPTLIPRPETEDWTMRLAQHVQPTAESPITLLDLCTGSGCIPLLLCRLWPPGSVRAFGVDVSTDAVQLARENASVSDVHIPSDTPTVPTPSASAPPQNTFLPLLADIRNPAFLSKAGLQPPFHVITSNPPYIPRREYDNLPRSVREYEDVRALLGDPDPGNEEQRGLSFYHAIAALVARAGILADDGVLAVEVGHGQAQDVARILHEEGGMQSTTIWKDPWQIDRVVLASKQPESS